MGQFVARNILFDDGTVTMPGRPTLLVDEPRCQATMRLLRALWGADLAGSIIIDLGCLEGGYSVEFARAGMSVLGIEVRRNNFENCCYVQSRLSLPNLQFIHDDVWNLSDYGLHDIGFFCGLLYHLDEPRRFLQLLGSCVNKAVIVNTHFAPWRPEERMGLGKLSSHEGLPGRWIGEHEATSHAERESLKLASWNNRRSFWLTREGIIQAIKDAGFNLVLEQCDAAGVERYDQTVPTDEVLLKDLLSNERRTFLRSVFIGIRDNPVAPTAIG